MPSQIQLLKQMVFVLDTLVTNATELNTLSKTSSSEEELLPFQNRQHEIFRELSTLDQLLQSSPLGESRDELQTLRKKVQDKLELFQKINAEFLSHLSARYRLINQKQQPPK